MSPAQKPLVLEARRVLQEPEARTPAELIQLGNRLRSDHEYRLARRILAAARAHPASTPAERLAAAQARVHATYTDAGLAAADRIERALAELDEADPLADTQSAETLGLAGAIHKRRWELYGRRQDLERSLGFYLRGYAQGVGSDGYAGINAAYMLDLLAAAEETDAAAAGIPSSRAEERRAQARRIRAELVDALSQQSLDDADWWALATLVEAHVGLGDNDGAQAVARVAAQREVDGWRRETMARQLVSVARLRGELPSAAAFETSPLAELLRVLFGQTYRGVRSAALGKVGLALSGGGFRAALYHIGVLARLAELDVLRNVEVMSCVSGGSIVGAHYYLELRNLLQTKADHEVDRQDYVDLVRRVERNFLAGVQKNPRVRIASNLWTSLKMLASPDYSRTHRAGELFERLIYSTVEDGEAKGPRWMDELYIRPAGDSPSFHPVHDNWKRGAKVPMLVLNATTLNTGHNWQFTASFMGEPPERTGVEIESNYRLRRMHYREAPPRHQRIRLGHAVAASACVPGLFEPLTLAGLYPDITVRLVDGGVHDNQGIVSLLEQNCTVLLVSDASGQMGTDDRPSEGPLGVSLRSSSILGSRVREAQYLDLEGLRQSGLLRGLMFVHLKKGLEVQNVSWIGSEDELDDDGPINAAAPAQRPRYRIHPEIQTRLAHIRTDLDTFSDAEAFSLMLAGYRMTAAELAAALPAVPVATDEPERWRFLAVEDELSRPAPELRFARLLEVGAQRVFKVWRLSRALQFVAAVAVLVVLGLIFTGGYHQTVLLSYGFGAAGAATPNVITLGGVIVSLFMLAIGFTAAKGVVRLIQYRKTLLQAGIGVLLVSLGFLAGWIHLLIFDPLFKRLGQAPAPHTTPTPVPVTEPAASPGAVVEPAP